MKSYFKFIYYLFFLIFIIIIFLQQKEIKDLLNQNNENLNKIKELNQLYDNQIDLRQRIQDRCDKKIKSVETTSKSSSSSSSFDFVKIDDNKGLCCSNISSCILPPDHLSHLFCEKQILKSTFNESYFIGNDSFINSLVGNILDITIRPDDIWYLIIEQISIYFNNHYKGNDFINWSGGYGSDGNNNNNHNFTLNIDGSDSNYQGLENEFKRLLQLHSNFSKIENVFSLVTPSFSTTTSNDIISTLTRLIGNSVINSRNNNNNSQNIKPMTSTDLNVNDQIYNTFTSKDSVAFSFNTNIPNIRLVGNKNDYINMIDKLSNLINQISNNDTRVETEDLVEWMEFIIPLLNKFKNTILIETKDVVGELLITKENRSKFWNTILDRNGVQSNSQNYLSGWITSFFYFKQFKNSLTLDFDNFYERQIIEMSNKEAAPYFLLFNLFPFNSKSSIIIDMVDRQTLEVVENARLIAGHLVSDISDNYKFKPRLDWVMTIINKYSNQMK